MTPSTFRVDTGIGLGFRPEIAASTSKYVGPEGAATKYGALKVECTVREANPLAGSITAGVDPITAIPSLIHGVAINLAAGGEPASQFPVGFLLQNMGGNEWDNCFAARSRHSTRGSAQTA